MDQSINLFTQSWTVAPPPVLFSNVTLPPIPHVFILNGDKCLTEAIRVARHVAVWHTAQTLMAHPTIAIQHASSGVINQVRGDNLTGL